MVKALVVVPTFNERATIEPLLRAVLAVDERISVLVVDDGSPDGTGALVERLAADDARVDVIHREGKQGLGSAYRLGLGLGVDRGFDVVGEMDADLSHDPADLPRLLAAITSGADMVIGSRYVAGGAIVGWPARRLALSRGGNAYVRLATGCPIRDATAGYRMYTSALLADIDVATATSEGYSFQLEMVLRAWQLGARIDEVPVTFTERRHGSSKLGRGVVVEAVRRTAGWGWAIRRGREVAHSVAS